MSKFGKILGVVGGVIGATSTVAGTVYTAQNPDLVKDYVKGNPTYTSQQMVDVKKDYEQKIETLEDENSKEVSRLNALITSINARITELEADNTAKSNKITELNNSMTLANTQISTLQSENASKDEEIETLNASIVANNTTISNLQTENTSLQTQITTLQEDNASNVSQIQTLTATIEANNTRIAELEQSDEDKSAEIAELQADNAVKNQEIATLTTSVNENIATISELEANIKNKDNTIAELQADNTAKTEEITVLQNAKTENEVTISNLQTQNVEYQAQIATLNNTVENNNNTISELQTKVNQYEEQYEGKVLITCIDATGTFVYLQEKYYPFYALGQGKEGYLFSGWSYTDNGDIIEARDLIFNENVTLYAVYVEETGENSEFAQTWVLNDELTFDTLVDSQPIEINCSFAIGTVTDASLKLFQYNGEDCCALGIDYTSFYAHRIGGEYLNIWTKANGWTTDVRELKFYEAVDEESTLYQWLLANATLQ